MRLRILVSLDQFYSIEFNVNNAVIPTDCNIIQLNWVFNSSYLSLFQLPTVDYNIIQLNNVVTPTDANNIQLNRVVFSKIQLNGILVLLGQGFWFQQNSIEQGLLLEMFRAADHQLFSAKFNWIESLLYWSMGFDIQHNSIEQVLIFKKN